MTSGGRSSSAIRVTIGVAPHTTITAIATAIGTSAAPGLFTSGTVAGWSGRRFASLPRDLVGLVATLDPE